MDLPIAHAVNLHEVYYRRAQPLERSIHFIDAGLRALGKDLGRKEQIVRQIEFSAEITENCFSAAVSRPCSQ